LTDLKNTVRHVGVDSEFSFSKSTFQEKATQIQRAADWLDSLGISFYRTRIGKYLKDIERLNTAYEKGSIQQLLDNGEFPQHVNSLFESSELIYIHEGLKTVSTEHLFPRLRDFTKGSEFVTAESTRSLSNKGRDIGFELFTASLFAHASFQPNFSTDADLMATNEMGTFFVECKRPQFDHSVRSNVRGAANQLNKRLTDPRNPEGAFGLIALSVSKIINPTQKLLVVSSEEVIHDMLGSESEIFINAQQQHWRKIENRRILGLIILIRTPAVIKSHSLLTTCNFVAGNNLLASGKAGLDLLISTVEKLKVGLFSNKLG
jgi:hypothetical protein